MIKLMEKVWAEAPYKGEKLLVLLALADWANQDGICWPSYKAIAAKTRITERGAMGVVKKLIEDGALTPTVNGGRGCTNEYKITLERVNELHPLEDGKGERSCTERVNVAAQKGERSCTPNKEPSGNRQKEPSAKATASLEEVKLHCQSLGLPVSDAEWFFYKCEGNGWMNGGNKIKNWRATISAWRAAGYMPSQKNPNANSSQTHRPNSTASPARPLTGAEQRQVGIPEVNGGRSLWSVIQERKAARAAADAMAAGEVQHGCDGEGSAANG